MKSFHIGGIQIRLLQKQDTLEMFEISAKSGELGPGLHFHRKMEESFYVICGKVLFTIADRKVLAVEGDSLSVPRNTPHSWKTASENTKMLLLFSPSQNQVEYFAELEKLQNAEGNWEKAISILAAKTDNTPV